jgi:hypothetical protein
MFPKIILSVLINFLIIFTIHAQGSCFVNQILSQEAIDNFATDHPGCIKVLGTLNITGIAGSGITNLEGLSQLEEIEGNISLGGLTLSNLQGMHNIKTVGGLSFQNVNIPNLKGLEALEEVAGNVFLNDLAITSLEGLDNLITIGQNLEMLNCHELTSVSGLTSLTEIGSSFKIYASPRLTNLIGLPSLELGNSIEITWCDSLSTLEGLDQITSDSIRSLTLRSNGNLLSLSGIENLTVQHGLTILGNDRLQSLEGLSLNDTLLGDFIISSNDSLTNLHGLEELKFVDDLDIVKNELLTSLDGLNSVKLIDVFLVEDNDVLTDFRGLDSLSILGFFTVENNPLLQSFQGLESLDTIYKFRVKGNDELRNFEGLSSLKSIKKGISILSNDRLSSVDGLVSLTFAESIGLTGNDALKNLDGFSKLLKLDGPFYVQSHDSLTDISGLSNIDPSTVNEEGGNVSSNDITIRKNPMLTECAITTVCNKFSLLDATFNIEQNGIGCQSAEEVMEQCETTTGIAGYLYEDINANGIYDLDDKPIANIKVSISLENNVQAIDYTDNEGYYRIFVDSGIYPLTYGSNTRCYLPELVDTMVEIIDSLVTMNDYSLTNIEDTPPLPNESYKIYLSRAATRCGFTVKHYVSIVNETCLDSYASMNYKFDDLIDSVFNISIPEMIVTQGVITYNIPELLTPGARFEFTFDATMPGVDAIDSLIKDSIKVDYIFPGFFDINESISEVFTSPITCAYDPNDKLAHPDRSNIYDEAYIVDEALIYTIRFQNTGNDTAFTVQLEDAISPLLDPSTLKPVLASHEYRYTLSIDTRLLTVTFDQILLPDSTTNQLGSNGFFTFSIMPISNLGEYTPIENFADIFFDFNPPIRTNTIELIYVSDLSIITSIALIDKHPYTIYPNPTFGSVSVKGLGDFHYEVYNLSGQLVRSGVSSGSIDLLELVSSVYILVLKDGNGQILGRDKIITR